jgi:hypothetical protein
MNVFDSLSLERDAGGKPVTTGYVLHARRAAFSLLDLKLLSIKTFRASVTGGSLLRIGLDQFLFCFR